jgi:hypothetical protein
MQLKRTTRYGAILLLITGLAFWGEAQSQPDSTPSLETTMQWLKVRMSSNTLVGSVSESDPNVMTSYKNASVNGCSITFTEEDDKSTTAESGAQKSIVKVPLGQLSSVEVTPYTRGAIVSLKSLNKAIDVKREKSGNVIGNLRIRIPTHGSESLSEFHIVVSDPAGAQSLANAFSHANELCGGNKGSQSQSYSGTLSQDTPLQAVVMVIKNAGAHGETQGPDKKVLSVVYSDVAAKNCTLTFTEENSEDQGYLIRFKDVETHSITVPMDKLVSVQQASFNKPEFNIRQSAIELKSNEQTIQDTYKNIVMAGSTHPFTSTGSETHFGFDIVFSDSALAQIPPGTFTKAIQSCRARVK